MESGILREHFVFEELEENRKYDTELYDDGNQKGIQRRRRVSEERGAEKDEECSSRNKEVRWWPYFEISGTTEQLDSEPIISERIN